MNKVDYSGTIFQLSCLIFFIIFIIIIIFLYRQLAAPNKPGHDVTVGFHFFI